jgi:broad specificity phosphatase PhoE
MALVHLVQHGEKAQEPDDPDLTVRGCSQARRAAQMLAQKGIDAIHTSPARRARRTAEIIAAECRALTVEVDERLRERMNWTVEQPMPAFLEEWVRATADRDYQPSAGESSRHAGQRLLAYLEHFRDAPITVAAATHGGVTVDLLRTLLGDKAVPPALLHGGVPPGAVTTVEGTRVTAIADVSHLRS